MVEEDQYRNQLKELEQELFQQKRFERISRTLFQVSNAVSLTTEPDQLYRSIHQALGGALDTTNFYIALYHPHEDTLSFPYCVDEVDGEYQEISNVSQTSSLTLDVILTGQSRLVTREQMLQRKDQSTSLLSACPISEIWLGVPLTVSDKTIGAMVVQSYTDSSLYKPEDLEILESVAGQVATAIEFKRSESARRRSEERNSAMIRQAIDGIFLLDPATRRIIDANASFLSLVGRSEKEIGTLSVHDFDAGPENEIDRIITEIISETGKKNCQSYRGERTFRKNDGTLIPVDISAVLYREKGSRYILAIARDTTERKRAGQAGEQPDLQRRHVLKMDAIGRLAGKIAEDANTMLSVVNGHTERALANTPPHNPVHVDLAGISHMTEHFADLTRQLLTFAGKQEMSCRVVSPNRIIDTVLATLRERIGDTNSLEWKPDKDIQLIMADPVQLNQAFTDICVNALDAIEDKTDGKIIIRTTNTSAGATLRIHPSAKGGEYICVQVQDNGHGIEPRHIPYIFEPFFTTKNSARRTGLGLATAYGIIGQNNGFIEVESTPGIGTSFLVYLPKQADTPEKQQNFEAKQPGSKKSHKTILIVEDDPAILTMCRIILEKHGYHVFTASTPDAALDITGTAASPIDLLLTDVTLPGMNGYALAQKIVPRHPGCRHLFMSGYTADIISTDDDPVGDIKLIEKPFSAKTLLQTIRDILMSESGS